MISRAKYGACLAVMLLSVAAVMLSCSNSNCGGNSTGIPLAAFYEAGSKVTVPNLTVYGIGAPNDSAIISKASATQVYLPFKLSDNSCQYVFNYNTEGIDNDTVTFEYDIIPYFESRECGAMYNFTITDCEYTRNVIDSVAILSTHITNSDAVTINIIMQ